MQPANHPQTVPQMIPGPEIKINKIQQQQKQEMVTSQRMEISGLRNLDSGFKLIHSDFVLIVKLRKTVNTLN